MPAAGHRDAMNEDSASIAPLIERAGVMYCRVEPLGETRRMYRCAVRRVRPGESVEMTWTHSDDIDAVFDEWSPGRILEVKFHGPDAPLGFLAQIIYMARERAIPMVRVAWPARLRRVALRRYERIQTDLPCSVVDLDEGTWLKGRILDLSTGGCRILTKQTAPNGALVALTVEMPDGSILEDVRSIVRQAIELDDGAGVWLPPRPRREAPGAQGGAVQLGCEFDAADAAAERDIQMYVANALEQIRQETRRGIRILIMEPDPALAAGLENEFQRRRFIVSTARGIVEGFSLLRDAAPNLLLVNVQQPRISGIEVCALLRETPGLERVPLFLYGPDMAEIEEEARRTGATGYLPDPASPERIASMFFARMKDVIRGAKRSGADDSASTE